ncbi:HipA N-terminal domain-containing protein [Chitinophaga pendula]|uniref:HipA N-terminal domain-containing protein n=1 Tax=Chitinophaga sp. MD30 TaxID=2033437 RepID=UPI0018DFBF00|nr:MULTISPECIES: HipA N-terminal domain-containing protein [Chitinophaga]UCJ07613.1 HipA N-terminal domain-containing protein [Chitinophaga pendula]
MNTAYVNLWGKRVGAIFWDSNSRVASFEYEPSFVTRNWDIAPLTMPIEVGVIYRFPELMTINAFKGLPGLLQMFYPTDTEIL